MFTKAFLEEAGNGKLRHEEELLRVELELRGFPISLYTAKKIQRRQLPLTGDAFISGDMGAMHGAMKQLKIEIPAPNDYPKSLLPYLNRRIWSSTLGSIESQIVEDDSGPVFAKPSDRRKSFTGRTFARLTTFVRLEVSVAGKQFGALRSLLGCPNFAYT